MRQAGPGICGSKYVEDVKAAHIVRVWSSCITKKKSLTEVLLGHPQMPGRSWRAGQARGDGKPAGPDRPLGKGDGGIK